MKIAVLFPARVWGFDLGLGFIGLRVQGLQRDGVTEGVSARGSTQVLAG